MTYPGGTSRVGAPRFARFDPPWRPWFLRHNEVVLPVSGNLETANPDA